MSDQLERRKGKLSLGGRTGGQWQMSHSRVKTNQQLFKKYFCTEEQEEILQNQVGPQTFSKRVIEHGSQSCVSLSHPTWQGEAE